VRERTSVSAPTDSAVKHFGKILLLFAAVGVLYSLALGAVCHMRAESTWSMLGPRAVSLKACLAEGWRNILYQPLFWLATGVVFTLYDAVTGEIDPQR
jgi:hypothetical protein